MHCDTLIKSPMAPGESRNTPISDTNSISILAYIIPKVNFFLRVAYRMFSPLQFWCYSPLILCAFRMLTLQHNFYKNIACILQPSAKPRNSQSFKCQFWCFASQNYFKCFGNVFGNCVSCFFHSRNRKICTLKFCPLALAAGAQFSCSAHIYDASVRSTVKAQMCQADIFPIFYC